MLLLEKIVVSASMVRYLPFVHANGVMPADASVFSILINMAADVLLYHIAEATKVLFRADLRYVSSDCDPAPPAACIIFADSSISAVVLLKITTDAPSFAMATAATRPSPQPAPVTTVTFP